MLSKIDIWRQAIKQSNEACCFISVDNYFLYCNEAWCRLLGYSEYELKQMTWLEITDSKDVGADFGQQQTVENNENDSYYLEKVYIRKDRNKIKVGIYVHRYPTNSSTEGYIVFCKKIEGSKEYEDLKEKFKKIECAVEALKIISENDQKIARLVESQGSFIKENRKLIMSIVGKSEANATSVNGDNMVGNFSGGIKNIANDSRVIFYVMAGFGFLCTALISLGVVLAYMAYYDTGNSNMEKPDINQPELRMQE